MQHYHDLKKLNFDLLTQVGNPRVGEGEGVYRQTICYHVAASGVMGGMINFNTVMFIYRHWVIMAYSEKLTHISFMSKRALCCPSAMGTRVPIQSAQKPYAAFSLPYVLYMKFDHNLRYILQCTDNDNRPLIYSLSYLT